MVNKEVASILLIALPLERYVQPWLGLGYLGASLLKNGHKVKIYDCSIAPNGISGIESEIRNFEPEYVGITGFTVQFSLVIETFQLVKKIDPKIITIFGGTHASVLPEYILNTVKEIDYVIIGEGEVSFPCLIAAIVNNQDLGTVPNLAYRKNRKNGRVFINVPKLIDNLDILEYPWKITNPLDYPQKKIHGYLYRQRPITQVISSRGCPYNCTFCAAHSVVGKKLRLRSPKKFVDELQYLSENFGIKEVQIVDDNFAFYKDHVIDVCQEIIKRKLNIVWSLPNGVRADRLDKEILILMKKAGCYYMSFGFEFGSPRTLQITKKSLDLVKACATVEMCNRLGFITQGFFLMGYPTENSNDLVLTAKLIKSLPLDRIFIGIPIPYPGSELFDYYLEKKYKNVYSINWNDFSEGKIETILENLNLEYIVRKIRKTYLTFYLNFFRIFNLLRKLKTFCQFKSMYVGFINVLLYSIVQRSRGIFKKIV